MHQKNKPIGLLTLLLFSGIAISSAAMAAPAVTKLSGQSLRHWQQDIRYFQQQLKTGHIAPFHQQTEQQFDSAINQLLEQLPKLSEMQVEVALVRIAAAVGDAHTGYNLMSGPHQHFPLRLKFFADELRVIGAAVEYQHLIGAVVQKIDHHSIAELLVTLRPYISYVENPYSYRHSFAFQLTIAKLLYGSGVTTSLQQAQFEFLQQGRLIHQSIEPVSMQQFTAVKPAYTLTLPKIEHFSEVTQGLSLGFVPQQQLAYLQFRSYATLEQMTQSCTQLQQRLQQQKSRYLAIDFRDNTGGNFFVGLALSACLLKLPQFDWQHGIFVLINEGTQSAAMANAAQYQQLLNARLVGAATGADPNHYMETGRDKLPNSGRAFSYSIRYYRFVPQPTDALYPDIAVPSDWESYQQGKDVVLQTVIQQIRLLQKGAAK